MNIKDEYQAGSGALSQTTSTFLERVGAAPRELSLHAREHPYAVLGVAAGIGFVLGGGLNTRLAGALLNVAGRAAVSHLANTWLASTASFSVHELTH